MNSAQRPVRQLASSLEGPADPAEDLYRRYYPSALRFARSLTHDLSSAEDLASEAFLRVWDRIRGGVNPHNMQSYLLTTVRNLYVDGIRARRHVADVDPDAEEVGVADDGIEDSIAERLILAPVMAALNPLYREVLVWTVLEGITNAAVAARLGISANACSSLTFRARQALRAAYLATRSDPVR